MRDRRGQMEGGASTRRTFASVSAMLAVFGGVGLFAGADAETKYLKTVEITWEDLWPQGEDARVEELFNSYLAATGRTSKDGIPEGGAGDAMPQIGTFATVPSMDGKRIRLAGYVVPLDFNARDQHVVFLLVPYFGACIHTPPPPPNQIVYVTARPAATIGNLRAPVWVEGVLSTKRKDSELANAAYSLTLSKVEPYDR